MPGAMNQYPDLQQFSLSPDMAPTALEATLSRLLVTGVISDRRLDRCCQRLAELFRTFAATSPVPEWAPGLQLTPELRRQYEFYLPVATIRAAFAMFCRLACRYEPLPFTAISASLSWPDALARLQPLPLAVNPARLLRRLAAVEEFRRAFLVALFMPHSYGGGFNRYPQQAEFLERWLAGQKQRLQGSVAILDAACGSGEGTYMAAATVVRLGFSVTSSRVVGSTLEPLELAAAAHGWFPRDDARAAIFRERTAGLLADGVQGMVRFIREDLCNPWPHKDKYDVIICNGLLGGPLLHDQEKLGGVVALLVKRLRPGGILLAEDRFHEGWKQATPPTAIKGLLTASGLQVIEAGAGIAAVRNGSADHPRRDRRQSP